MLPTNIIKSKINENNIIRQIPIIFQTIRYGHTIRGKPPGVARTIEQRLQDENVIDPVIAKKINIGFPQLKLSRSIVLKERLAHVKAQRKNVDIEKQAKSKTLEIDLDQVKTDWITNNGQFDIKKIAEHYGIYQHLYGDAYFIPRIPLNIKYSLSDDSELPVCWGNVIKPREAQAQPNISFDANMLLLGEKENNKQSFWTLLMTNPDGHLTENNKEYVHWFIGNIPNGDLSKGDVIIPYLQPFPPKGTGFHRHIFVLYKQNELLDYNNYKITKLNDLVARTFSTLDFYRKYQDNITPAGLSFFQSDWDESVKDFFHNVLELKEPHYEYDFPRPYIKDQKWFPLREPFNLYLNKYRDPKQISKEYLEKKLANTHPFNGPNPKLRYPNAHPIRGVPSWLRTEIRKDRLGIGRINDI